jgi:hypothetical protein
MGSSFVRGLLVFSFVIALVAALYWLTLYQPEDPCAEGQQDISGAVLAEGEGDQDALVNRAIIRRGHCDRPATGEDADKEESGQNPEP